MKISYFSRLACATFVTTLLCSQPRLAQAGGEGFSTDGGGKEVIDSKGDLGLGKYSSFPFHVSVSVRGGYDDNVNLSSFNEQDSFFTNAALGVTYEFGSPRTRINLNAGVGATYYFDRDEDGFNDGNGSDDFDVNAFVGFAITHKATPRLTLAANLFATYQSQPDFQTFNNSTITFGRQSQNFFFTVNKFSLGYAWTPRFSTVSSYTLGYTDYDDEDVSSFEDRFEHTIGNEFRYLILPTTTLVGEYRFGIVDYTENDFRNSTSHYFLAGLDHSFNPRFNLSARGGVEVRNYDNDDDGVFDNSIAGDQTSPYGELTVNYAIAQSTSLSWTSRYSIEESDVPEFLNRQTYRTALSLRHAFTARISTGLNFAYQHDDYDGNAITSSFEEDAFDVSLSIRYAINRNIALDAGYHHTEVISDGGFFREYTRNRVYAGATFTF